jgi:hypothetical protein
LHREMGLNVRTGFSRAERTGDPGFVSTGA